MAAPQAAQTPAPAWSSTELQRPMNLLETWFRDVIAGGPIQNRDPLAITLGLKLKFPDSVADPAIHLRRAWVLVRKDHPLLGAVYPLSEKHGTKKNYITLHVTDDDDWLQTTFMVHRGDEALFQKAEDVARDSQPFPIMAHWFPDTSEFVLRKSHQGTDGTGLLMMLHCFLKTLQYTLQPMLDFDATNDVSEAFHSNFSTGLSELFKYDPKSPLPPRISKAVESSFELYSNSRQSISLPTREGEEIIASTAIDHLRISFDDVTSKLIKKSCANKGISIATAIHTSIIRVVSSFPQHPDAKHALASVVMSLRAQLPKSYHRKEHTIGFYVFSLPFCIPNVKDYQSFDDLAGKVGVIYSSGIGFPKDEDGRPVNIFEVIPAFCDRHMKMLKEDPLAIPSPPTPTVSSLGLLEKILQREYAFGDGGNTIKVEDFCIGSEVTVSIPVFHIWTFRDKINIEISFNASFLDNEFMEDLCEKIKDELIKGLKVDQNMPRM